MVLLFSFYEVDSTIEDDVSVASETDASAPTDELNYDLAIPVNSYDAVYSTPVTKHLYNIELLLLIIVVIMVARLSRDLFRTLFKNLLK